MVGRGAVTAFAVLAFTGCVAYGQRNVPVAEVAGPEAQRVVLVTTPQDFSEAVKQANPGDKIVLANGVWADFDAVFHAEGTAGSPIQLVAETPGKVILSGQSSLRLAGNYLIVSGLVFRDGYTPRSEVISFRRDSNHLASNSRVTNTVIDSYSNPDRTQRDLWVGMYGRNNTFDFNHLENKTNAGPTMAVRLNTEESQENGHRIANNYFGPRPVLGSNGGETLRIGTSHYSLTHSGTVVENNFFDRCSGEVEIVSNKSGGNIYRGNTFHASRGTLTLRHGNGTLIENNLFDGAGEPYTGGVRVINAEQTIRNNYFRDLTGIRFSGALVIMNGVPNSPVNRYHQVNGAVIERNTFDQVSSIELGEGADSERSAVPVNSRFQNNIVLGKGGVNPFHLHDDVSGIAFADNLGSGGWPEAIASGFSTFESPTQIGKRSWIQPSAGAGAAGPYGVALSATGVDWYPKASAASPFEGGAVVTLKPGTDVLFDALQGANAGDQFILEPGNYLESRIITLSVPVSIKAEGRGSARLSFERPQLFKLTGNGGLRLDGVTVTGRSAPDGSGNSLVGTSSSDGSNNHLLDLKNSRFEDFDVNRGFSVVAASKGSFFDRIDVENSEFENISGPVFKLDAETDDYGIYNAEYIEISDSSFARIGKTVASVYRGGTDESTFGPHVIVTGSSFETIGSGDVPIMDLHGIQYVKFSGNNVTAANPVALTLTTGKPELDFSANKLDEAPADTFATTVDLRGKN
jgi:poly(beta-D-mannuronate) lyase